MGFRDDWLTAVKDKDSVLCAGLDPAVYDMGRGEKGLPKETNKRIWALDYVAAVAPFCAAVKPNIQYWKGPGDAEILEEVVDLAHERGMVVIEDAKLADIGSTNDAGMFYAVQRKADAVTLAPFAGNMAEAAEQARKRNIGLITMCLMSNPEYATQKTKLVRIKSEELQKAGDIELKLYGAADVIRTDSEGIGEDQHILPHIHQYIHLAVNARTYGLDGIVIGAPSASNHITEEEITRVRRNVGDEMLVLLPGVGAQGGEADAIWRYFSPDNVIVNVGRSLMFPKEGNHADTAKKYRDMLNNLRKAS